MKKYVVGVDFLSRIEVEVFADSVKQAEKLAVDLAKKHNLDMATATFDGVYTINEEDVVPIMNTTNNHNPELVEAINMAYYMKPDEFKEIISILKKRDLPEILALDGSNTDGICEDYDYLMHCADDRDLQCILDYCRFEPQIK